MKWLQTAVEKDFETLIKPGFKGLAEDDHRRMYITAPCFEEESLWHCVSGNKVELTGKEIREHVFDVVVARVRELVRNQIANTTLAQGGSPVKAVLLAGGFGQNAYLLSQIEEEVGPDVQVLQIDNTRAPDYNRTAIARGALIWGLSRTTAAGRTGDGRSPVEATHVRAPRAPGRVLHGIPPDSAARRDAHERHHGAARELLDRLDRQGGPRLHPRSRTAAGRAGDGRSRASSLGGCSNRNRNEGSWRSPQTLRFATVSSRTSRRHYGVAVFEDYDETKELHQLGFRLPGKPGKPDQIEVMKWFVRKVGFALFQLRRALPNANKSGCQKGDKWKKGSQSRLRCITARKQPKAQGGRPLSQINQGSLLRAFSHLQYCYCR
jgi:hypothetical protein